MMTRNMNIIANMVIIIYIIIIFSLINGISTTNTNNNTIIWTSRQRPWIILDDVNEYHKCVACGDWKVCCVALYCTAFGST